MEEELRKELQNLAIKTNNILQEELLSHKLTYKLATAYIYDQKTVGVQGDERTYGYPAEITFNQLRKSDGTLFYAKRNKKEFYEFLDRLSTRITNEVTGINRIVWPLAYRGSDGTIWTLEDELKDEYLREIVNTLSSIQHHSLSPL
ncbi:MAG: hypothetical protein AABW63_02885 [Nanoarchaeota archaeon]